MKKILLLLVSGFIMCLPAMSWKGMTMSKLHIEGRYLCDEEGNHVLLHGYGQTYSPWFNEQGKGWGWGKNVSACLTYNQGLIKKIDEAGWKVNWLRLHMDPHWSNKDGIQTTGENDISAFDEDLFRKYLNEVFVPMAEYANSYGLYVVMRPPGVCPEKIAIDDKYHKYLRKVWTIVCSHEKLKNNPYIMFELANEPINILGTDGQYRSWGDGQYKNCTKFFQTIVDDIRKLGCNNILWVPGLSYQMNYQGYVQYPVVDTKDGLGIGYAVHCYPGWYGSDSEADNGSVEQGVVTKGAGYAEFQAGWNTSVGGIAKKAPILITEMDWAPKKYNCSWGKATTGELGGVGFGANFKYIMDKTGNVSWMLFTGPEHLAKYKYYAPDGKTFLTDPEACVRPIYNWYKEYAKPDWEFDDVLSKTLWFFPGTEAIFSSNIWETGSITNTSSEHTLVTGQYGFGGWQFPGGMDMSQYKYLVVRFSKRATSGGWSLRLFDKESYWTEPFMTDCQNRDRVIVNLASMKRNNSSDYVSPKHIYILGFWSMGGTPLSIKDVYLTNNSDYSPEVETGVADVMVEDKEGEAAAYTIQGQRIGNMNAVPAGTMFIYKGKKYIR